MRVHKEHRFECPADRLWDIIFDGDFETRMSLEALASERCEVLERNVDGDAQRLHTRITPRDNLPGFIKKLVGSGFGFQELRERRRGEGSMRGTMTPSVLKDKMRMTYDLRVVPEGDGACRRIMDWNVEVKIFGIGGQIEKFAAGEVEKGVDASAAYISKHLKAQQAT